MFLISYELTSFCLPASNGNPRLPDSLHYLDPSGRPNAYQRVRNDACFELTSLFVFDPCAMNAFF